MISSTLVLALPVVCLYDLPSNDFVSSNAAVVRSLGTWETILGPSQRPVVKVQECVFLLDTEPGLGALGLFHSLLTGIALVALERLIVRVVGVAEDKFVVALTEGVFVDRHWVQENVAVASFGLVGRTTVVRPFWQLCNSFLLVFTHIFCKKKKILQRNHLH